MTLINRFLLFALLGTVLCFVPANCSERVSKEKLKSYEQLQKVFAEYLRSHHDELQKTLPADLAPLIDSSVGPVFVEGMPR